MYPNATSTRERANPQTLAPEAASFTKAKRKERTPFTKQEDENLLLGFHKYGGKWSLIQKDESLGLAHRRSTDLRDRFRNAFPDKYIGAGFKPPPAKKRRRADEETGADDSAKAETSSGTAGDTQQLPGTFEFRADVNPMPTSTMQVSESTTSGRDHMVALPSSTGEQFSHTRISWTNPHNAAMQKEMEMAIKLRRALDMSTATEMMGEPEIPLDPGLNEVTYQPSTQNHDSEALTGLLDAAVQHETWKRD